MQQKYSKSDTKTSFSLKTSSLLLDTLAQPDGNHQKKGSNFLKKRAVSKHLTNKNIFPLIDLKSDLEKAYWKTFHCTNVLLQEGKKITGRYCNNRWCLVCNRIRTAKLIKGYLPVIRSEIKEPFFVTLTVPNVPDLELRVTIMALIQTFININRYLRDHKQGLKGVRKLESTFNLRGKDYHPHLHALVDGESQARLLASSWLDAYPDADERGQDYRPADEGSLIELFKYSTKMTASQDKRKIMPPEALDVIFKALYKVRTYQPFGIKKIVPDENISEIQAEEVQNLISAVDVWVWEQELKDWLNSDGEFLTEYTEHET